MAMELTSKSNKYNMGSQHDYMPKTYEPIVPPKPHTAPTIPVPTAFQSPPTISTPMPSPALPPTQVGAGPTSPGGNGMVWCSGPSAPGWNVNLPNGGCTPSKPTVVHLDQLPYTGDSPIDVMGMNFLYIFAIIFGLLAIYRIIQAKGWM